MATAEQIQKAYIDFVLTNDEQPKSVYSFVKKLKITESEFYAYYASFESIEKNIWVDILRVTLDEIQKQELWSKYSSREKMLSFFYSYIELLKANRSFVTYSLKSHQKTIGTPSVLSGVKPIFENFAEEIINEGLETGELAERKFFSKRYKGALWVQYSFILNFWVGDDSDGFEKTDEAIEKGIQVTFDLFQRSPIDNLFEYGKFLAQNGKFKEKMKF